MKGGSIIHPQPNEATTVNNGFNGYVEWLGIDTHGKLMTYYRLLGVTALEKDVAVIESAAANQQALLEPHIIGPHSQVASRILN